MEQTRETSGAVTLAGRVRGEQRGDIITSWLVQILLVLAVIGLIVYEILSVAITHVRLDDSAREVAITARDVYRGERSLREAATIAEEVAATHGVEVLDVAVDGDDLVIEMEKRAPTLLVHRVGPVADLATASTSSRVRWAS